MKSSFKKIQKSTATSKSNKCHFGHPQLDAIFNGSLSKGHMMIIEQDHPSINYLSLLRYYVSSNYHSDIPCLIYDTVPSKWYNLISPIDKKVSEKTVSTSKNDSNNDTSTGTTDQSPISKSQYAKNSTTTSKTKIQIAWRYNNMNIQLNELIVNDKMSFLDLNKQIPSSKLNRQLLHCNEYPNNNLKSLQQFYKQIEQQYLEINSDEKDTRPKKILLSSLPSYIYQQEKPFYRFLQALRCLTRSSHVFTLITVPPIISNQIRNRLIFTSDYYLQCTKVAKGYDDFSGVISILKEVEACSIRTNHRGISLWGIKNKKKEFRIESLYEQAVEEQLQEQPVEGEENETEAEGKIKKGKIQNQTEGGQEGEEGSKLAKKELMKHGPPMGNIDF